ncbi:unnamed protein product [Ambrosiozyma monospora]|uniref:Unnamed protein product n=1 Tax=Ambrosiozyma monospora TaxID=43982 RepID=A0ACB5T0M0_AMBMO|nr:unnamed protein product [Ambrosiozyma monospora]
MLRGGQIDSFHLKDASPLSKLERSARTHNNNNNNNPNNSSSLNNVINNDRSDRMSIISQDSIATTGRLLDKLGLEDDEFEDLESIMPDDYGYDDDTDTEDDNAISVPASQFRSLKPMLMNQRATDMRAHAVNSAIALGSKVNQTQHRSPKLVQSNFSRVSFHASDPSLNGDADDNDLDNDNETIYSDATDGSSYREAPVTPPKLQQHGRNPSFEITPSYGFANQDGLIPRDAQHTHSVSNPSDMASFKDVSDSRNSRSPRSPLTKTFHSKFYHATAPQPISQIDPPSPLRMSSEYVPAPQTTSATQQSFPHDGGMEAVSKRALGELMRTPSAPSLRKPLQAPPVPPNVARQRLQQMRPGPGVGPGPNGMNGMNGHPPHDYMERAYNRPVEQKIQAGKPPGIGQLQGPKSQSQPQLQAPPPNPLHYNVRQRSGSQVSMNRMNGGMPPIAQQQQQQQQQQFQQQQQQPQPPQGNGKISSSPHSSNSSTETLLKLQQQQQQQQQQIQRQASGNDSRVPPRTNSEHSLTKSQHSETPPQQYAQLQHQQSTQSQTQLQSPQSVPLSQTH